MHRDIGLMIHTRTHTHTHAYAHIHTRTHTHTHIYIYIYIYIERLTEIYFVCNILRPYNYKAISKIKNDNRASNESYN